MKLNPIYDPIIQCEDRVLKCVRNSDALRDMVLRHASDNVVALDTETTPFMPWHDKHRILGISLAWSETVGYYLPLGHEEPLERGLFDDPVPKLDMVEVRSELRKVLDNADIVIAHNWKFDLGVLERADLPIPKNIYDTYIAAGVANITAERRLGLKELTRNWIGRDVSDITDLDKGADLTCAPIPQVTRYAGDDACNAYALWEITKQNLSVSTGVQAIFDKVEMPVVDITRRMEHKGILLDEDKLLEIHKQAVQTEEETLEILRSISGYRFDPSKTTHVRHMFYDVFCLPEGRRGGKVTSDRKLLVLLYEQLDAKRKTDAQAFFDAYMLNREANKIKTTYTHSLLDLRDSRGRIHPGFLQVNAASGRYTSRQPNFQNLPRDDSGLFDVRSAFVADPGYVFVIYDFQQMEFKLAAAYSQDPFLVKAANDSAIDVHNNTARACFNIPKTSDVPKDKRQAAKTITFAILFGATGYGLSRQLVGVSPKQGERLVAKFYDAYRGLKKWTDTLHISIAQRGYAETYYGRRRWADKKKLAEASPDVKDGELRKLANTVIQGTGADVTKIAMKKVDRRLRLEHPEAQIVGQIHDELVVLCPATQALEVSRVMESEMIAEVFGVTLLVDGDVKYNLSKHSEE